MDEVLDKHHAFTLAAPRRAGFGRSASIGRASGTCLSSKSMCRRVSACSPPRPTAPFEALVRTLLYQAGPLQHHRNKGGHFALVPSSPNIFVDELAQDLRVHALIRQDEGEGN